LLGVLHEFRTLQVGAQRSNTLQEWGTLQESAALQEFGALREWVTLQEFSTLRESATLQEFGTLQEWATLQELGTLQESATLQEFGELSYRHPGYRQTTILIILFGTKTTFFGGFPSNHFCTLGSASTMASTSAEVACREMVISIRVFPFRATG
jgi:hypothetical protein